MDKTPLLHRRHVVIFGQTNAGKSALFNALLGQELAIVSPQSGTTTDPVSKGAELLPFGPVTLVDTAGLGDESALGQSRQSKTRGWLGRADLALYAVDIRDFDPARYAALTAELSRRGTPVLPVLTKDDLLTPEERARARARFGADVCAVSVSDADSIAALRRRMADALSRLGDEEPPLLDGLLAGGGFVLLVCPIDSAAPRGRLILPQVQLIRECLDGGLCCTVVTVETLPAALAALKRVDLVVTDSQAFGAVAELVPPDMPLTSFSILTARQKGDIRALVHGAAAVRALRDGDRVLIAESCTHNTTHEDIGRVKLPAMLQKRTGKALVFEYASGHDFPEELGRFALVVHCGGCMMTRKAFSARLAAARQAGVPMTNYGVALALGAGVLDRGVAALGLAAEARPQQDDPASARADGEAAHES